MSTDSNDRDQSGGLRNGGDVPAERRRSGLTCFVVLLIGLALLAAIGVFFPALQSPREAGRFTQCNMNLRQIGLAMFNYHQKYGCFPPAFVADQNGKPKHSWRVLLLPFLDQIALYKQYRFDEPWNGPHNSQLAGQMPQIYGCPTCKYQLRDEPAQSQACYAMLVGPHAITDGPTPRKMGDIKDGISNTATVAECAGAGINWLEPRDIDVGKMTYRIASLGDAQRVCLTDICTSHPGVANVLFCDGAVHRVPVDIEPGRLKSLITIDGREPVNTAFP